MEKVTLSFSAKGQSLTGCPFKFASNTVNYIEAKFELRENWGGFDSVRAVWFTDFNCISTVLDTDGVCVVPHEVLNKAKREVKVNLVGSIVENGELTDRLTTYPIKAIIIDANAKICGSETAEVTPSQFEQFVEAVKAEVAKIKDIDSVELNDDYTLTIYFSDDTETTVGPIRGEQGPAGPQGEQGETGNGIASIEKTGTAGYVDTYTITFTDGTTTTFEVRNGEVSLETLESLMPIDTASGDIASFPDGQNVFPLKSLVADIDPIQDLSHGDPSPTNICPISGHTEVDVVRTGKNLADYEYRNQSPSISTGAMISYNSWNTDYIKVDNAKQYSLQIYNSTSSNYVLFYDSNKTFLGYGGVSADTHYVISNSTYFTNTKYIKIRSDNGSGTDPQIMFEFGTTSSPYTAYNGQTYTTTLPSTTYGGTLDLVSGELTVDRVSVDLGTLTWVRSSTNTSGKYRMQTNGLSSLMKLPSDNNTKANILCDRYETITANSVYGRTVGVGGYASGYLAIYDTNYDDGTDATIAAFNSAMNGVQLVYELATPQTYQLTPQQIQTLLGTNNVWANSGDVEVVYIADIKLYVDNH